jgi:hypothetical protein
LSSPAWFITQDIRKIQKQVLLKIFFSFDVVSCQKVVNMMFFEDLYFVGFCDEINFKDSYTHEIFMILDQKNETAKKKFFLLFNALLRGVTN